jgi:hypothetical protein
MKNILRISIVFLAFLIIGFKPLLSQSYEFVRADTLVRATVDDLIVSYAECKNISASAKSTKVRVSPVTLVAGHKYVFCAPGQCYPESETISESGAFNLNAGESTGNYFTLDLNVNNIPGTSTLAVRFFNDNNITDYIEYNATYVVTVTSVEDGKESAYVSILSYPNPATNFINLKYNIPFASNNVKCSIYNSAGSFVTSLPVAGQEGNLNINTSALVSGNYYFVFVNGNQKIVDGNFSVMR